jgi:ATP-dependent Clp protease protease subunit
MSDDDIKEKGEENESDQQPPQVYFIDNGGDSSPQTRIVNLFGNLDEDTLAEVVQTLVSLKGVCQDVPPVQEGEEPLDPESIKFYISTWGGDLLGMFAIYDMMKLIKKECVIETIGLGKVMSAGVLLLAAGSKGHRKVGKNTRIMIHNVRGGNYGPVPTLQNELKETLWLQGRMVEQLAAETKLTPRKLKKMLDQKIDIYIGAEEAIELGIADTII